MINDMRHRSPASVRLALTLSTVLCATGSSGFFPGIHHRRCQSVSSMVRSGKKPWQRSRCGEYLPMERSTVDPGKTTLFPLRMTNNDRRELRKTSLTDEQLQKRFDEVMQRRKQRLSNKKQLLSHDDEPDDTSGMYEGIPSFDCYMENDEVKGPTEKVPKTNIEPESVKSRKKVSKNQTLSQNEDAKSTMQRIRHSHVRRDSGRRIVPKSVQETRKNASNDAMETDDTSSRGEGIPTSEYYVGIDEAKGVTEKDCKINIELESVESRKEVSKHRTLSEDEDAKSTIQSTRQSHVRRDNGRRTQPKSSQETRKSAPNDAMATDDISRLGKGKPTSGYYMASENSKAQGATEKDAEINIGPESGESSRKFSKYPMVSEIEDDKSPSQTTKSSKNRMVSKNEDDISPTQSTRQRQFRRDSDRKTPPYVVQDARKNDLNDAVDERETFDDDYEGDYEDRYSWDDPYDEYNDERYYDDYNQVYSPLSSPTFEWETYRSSSILFPNQSKEKLPKAIIHFVGGTLFGSYPRKFYGSLLESISLKCEAVVVATPIPLVLPGKGLVTKLEKWMFDEGGQGRRGRSDRESTNPLDHLCLAEIIQKEFITAYRDVVLDEYCFDYATDNEVEDFMKNVPIVGIGHSLGARIQAISCSHPGISKRYLSLGLGNRLIRSGREGMVYLGFANWGASSSIPGVATLGRTAKRRNQGRRGAGRQEDVWGDRSTSRRRREDSYYDQYNADDLELSDIFSYVFSGVAKGAKQIGEALTPETEDLEFIPTPNELWDSLSSPDGWYSQNCQNNLIVQFDEDPIDQGSRLARTFLTVHRAELNSTNTSDTEPLIDVKFARLPGGHLAPVGSEEGIRKFLPRRAVYLVSSSYDFILERLDAEMPGKSKPKQQREIKDVAGTVASFINSLNDEE